MTDNDEKTNSDAEQASKESSAWSYHLVVIMLFILAGLVVLIIFMPVIFEWMWRGPQDSREYAQAITEYSKWALSVLLGAFGAWIGAGAAYFFGKENLKESSRSTESALKIQRDSFQRPGPVERIKDMALTAMNPNFYFYPDTMTSEVADKLKKAFRGYWFVPMVEKDKGTLKDVIHAQVFWDPAFAGKTLNDLIAAMDDDEDLKKLHGQSFYGTVSPNEKISDVFKRLNDKNAEVAIVVDDNGKPSHCLTRTQLRTLLKVTD